MKVVIFCGGLGMRLREYADNVPKPMVPIGYRPVLWHVMKYYAHYGHKDFILCLGYRADAIKQYFLHYDECVSNDFSLSNGGKDLQLFNSDVKSIRDTELRINCGYFVFKREIFQYMRNGEELVLEPFERLMRQKQLMAYRHDGFYASMDTFKDKQQLDDMYAHGDAPWEVWRNARPREEAAVSILDAAADAT